MDEPCLLVVDDEPYVCAMIEAYLRGEGYRVTSVQSAEAALDLLETNRFSLLVTDLILGRDDGIALMREARLIDPDLEAILITGAATIDAVIAALDSGAHSCLLKPMRLDELGGRVRSALQRRQERIERNQALRHLSAHLLRLAETPALDTKAANARVASLRIGPLQLDPGRRRVAVGPREISVSSSEFDLLLYLAHRDHQVVSSEEIAREVLRYGSCSTDESRELVKARIYRLRRKLEAAAGAPNLLVSVRGAGYMLTAGD